MKWSLFIFFALLFFLFLPIPIKLTATYSNNQLCLYIFNFNVKLNKKKRKKKDEKELEKSSRLANLTLQDGKYFINKLECLRFKPTLRLSMNLNYGLLDASSTGIAYGMLNSLSPFLHKLLTIVFKVKSYDLDMKPNFNQLMIDAAVKSIIFINLAKIIYIATVVLKSYKFIKQRKNYACSNV